MPFKVILIFAWFSLIVKSRALSLGGTINCVGVLWTRRPRKAAIAHRTNRHAEQGQEPQTAQYASRLHRLGMPAHLQGK